MSPPANVTVNFPVPFPALVVGDGSISVTKVNGVWHVGISYATQLDRLPPPATYATTFLLYYDVGTNANYKISIAELGGLFGGIPAPTIVTAAGTYNVAATDTVVLINKTVSAAASVQLPTIASRFGVPIVVKDFKGDAAGNNITILPSGAETIEGAANKVITTNYGRFKLVPIAGQTKWYVDGT